MKRQMMSPPNLADWVCRAKINPPEFSAVEMLKSTRCHEKQASQEKLNMTSS